MKNVIIFLCGVAVGAVTTWKIVEQKYKKISKEEIDSVKEVYGRGHRADSVMVDEVAFPVSKPKISEEKEKEIRKQEQIINENDYVMGFDLAAGTTYKKEDNKMKPEVITPEEFGDDPDYDCNTLWYYADEVVADDQDNVLDDEDIENTIGKDALSHFGEYEDDSVFIRNDDIGAYFEILLDTRKFSEVLESKAGE